MLHFKKVSTLLLMAVVLLFASGCQGTPSDSEKREIQEQFDAFLEQAFLDTMESEYTALHVYVTDPESFGIDMDQVEVGLGSGVSSEDIAEEREAIEQSLSQLEAFPYEVLTDEQKDSYDIYHAQLSLEQKLSDETFYYYGSVFSSMSGLHYQYPTLLADWEIRDEEDLQNMIIMVKDILPYTRAALEYTKEQEEAGLLMIDFDSVLNYCQRIIEKGENTSVLTSIDENIDALDMEESQKEAYKAQMKAAISESFLPAYEEIYMTLSELKEKGTNNEKGLAAFQKGKEYYTLLLQQNSGSEKTVEELRKLMEDAFDRHMQNFMTAALADMDAYEKYMNDEIDPTGFTSYEEILDFIKGKLEADFPTVKDLTYNIKDVNEEIASDSGVTAYFNIPSLDGTQVKQMRVNPKTNDVASLATYSTVAHEGFTGHMYQYGYMYEHQSSNFRKAIAQSNAYTEGYATYAQYECMDYLTDYDSGLLEIYKEFEMMNNSLAVLLDIGIHYDGWDVEDVADYLTELGLVVEADGLQGLYKQLQANPAAFAPYYIGYEEIAAMKEMAQEALQDRFTDKGFNEALLASGTAPFDVVQRHIEAYIEKNQ